MNNSFSNDYTPALYRGRSKEEWINKIINEHNEIINLSDNTCEKNVRYDIMANKFCTIFYAKYPFLQEDFYDGVCSAVQIIEQLIDNLENNW
jgi:hypothetical protein